MFFADTVALPESRASDPPQLNIVSGTVDLACNRPDRALKIRLGTVFCAEPLPMVKEIRYGGNGRNEIQSAFHLIAVQQFTPASKVDLRKHGNQSLFEAYVQYVHSPKHTVGEQLLEVRRDKRERAAFAAAEETRHLGPVEEGEDDDDDMEEDSIGPGNDEVTHRCQPVGWE